MRRQFYSLRFVAIIGCLACVPAAQASPMTLVDHSRGVSAEADATGMLYGGYVSDAESFVAPDAGPFDETAYAEVYLNEAEPQIANATASQTSSITPMLLSVASQSDVSQYYADGEASTYYSVTFDLAVPTVLRLFGTIAGDGLDFLMLAVEYPINVTLTEVVPPGEPQLPEPFVHFDATDFGTIDETYSLAAGRYTFATDTRADFATTDEGREQWTAEINMQLEVVPEPATMSLGALPLLRRRHLALR